MATVGAFPEGTLETSGGIWQVTQPEFDQIYSSLSNFGSTSQISPPGSGYTTYTLTPGGANKLWLQEVLSVLQSESQAYVVISKNWLNGDYMLMVARNPSTKQGNAIGPNASGVVLYPRGTPDATPGSPPTPQNPAPPTDGNGLSVGDFFIGTLETSGGLLQVTDWAFQVILQTMVPYYFVRQIETPNTNPSIVTRTLYFSLTGPGIKPWAGTGSASEALLDQVNTHPDFKVVLPVTWNTNSEHPMTLTNDPNVIGQASASLGQNATRVVLIPRGAVDTAPNPPGTTSTTKSSSAVPWIVGGVVLLGAGLWYVNSGRPRRRS